MVPLNNSRRDFRTTLFAWLFTSVSIGIYLKATYHGTWPQNTPFKNPPQVSLDRVVAEARKLRGVAYDPLMGGHNNIGGRSGFLVCVDVPLLAYWNAGYSIRETLDEDFAKQPRSYDVRDGNIPGNPFFHRRARNLYAYCRANGLIRNRAETPRPGDIVFLSKTKTGPLVHVALISAVSAGGEITVIEAATRLLWIRKCH